MKFIIAALMFLFFTTSTASAEGEKGMFKYVCPSVEAGLKAKEIFTTKYKSRQEWFKTRSKMFDGDPCATFPSAVELTAVETIKTFVSARGIPFSLIRAKHYSGAEFFVFGIYDKGRPA